MNFLYAPGPWEITHPMTADVYLIIFCSIIVVCVVGTIIVGTIGFRRDKKRYDRLFNAETIPTYEAQVASLIAPHTAEEICKTFSLEDICAKFNIILLHEEPGGPLSFEDVGVTHENGKYIIRVRWDLKYSYQKYLVFRSIIQILLHDHPADQHQPRWYEVWPTDDESYIRAYMAQALAFPMSEVQKMIQQYKFFDLSKSERIRVLERVGEEYHLTEEIVYGRLRVYRTLHGI